MGKNHLIKRQALEIKKGGLPVILQKLRTLLLFPLAVSGVFIVRLLRPWLLIRFGLLHSSRLGHFAANTELYLCQRDLGLCGRRSFDIFYSQHIVSNQQLHKMWKRTGKLHIFPFYNLMALVDRLNQLLPGGKEHVIITSDKDLYLVLNRTQMHLFFTTEEERLGSVAFKKLGLLDGRPFVCFYARDPSYLSTIFPQNNWRYHDYRNANINNYLPAVKELTQRGYYAVRMGSIVKGELKGIDSKIIDYSVNGRTDFLDIFLAAKCRFFLTSTGGLTNLLAIFRKPIAYANFIPIGIECLYRCAPGSIFIPKNLWLRQERRFLTFREIFSLGADNFLSSEEYEQLGIEVIENTPQEITDLAIEMDERLKGSWRPQREDEELQRKFCAIVMPQGDVRSPLPLLGSKFLRQYKELLN